MIGPLLGGVAGAGFFLWMAGIRVVNPNHIAWVMQLDWRFPFLGWHFFRREPWHWPPGLIEGYNAPLGSSIGYTDSVPIIAFLLKPFDSWLPMPMQYLGCWLLLCFALQGFFAALIARVWTPSALLQVLSAVLFVLTPALLNRGGHPSLCAHWLLLWAIWLYCRPAFDRAAAAQMVALGAIAGLVHPYLAAMALAVLAAIVWRQAGSAGHRWRPALLAWAGSAAAVMIGWWAAGLFKLPATDLVSAGLSDFSMNLLGPLTPLGWSRFVPALPAPSPERAFEGFQYLGAGSLVLLVVAAAVQVAHRGWTALRRFIPLIVCCTALALYALGPTIMFGHTIVLDYSSAWLDRWAVFRVTGRFFWPMSYLALALAVGSLVRRLPPRVAAAVLAAGIAIQVVDLRPGHRLIHELTGSRSFATWDAAPASPDWARILPRYRHLVMVLPGQCGESAASFEMPAYLAGVYGLTFNGGEQARWSNAQNAAYCSSLRERLRRGAVDDAEIYVVFPGYLATLRSDAPALVCAAIDRLPVCVTSRSYQGWREAAAFQ